MKKPFILLFLILCGYATLPAQIKIILVQDLEKSKSQATYAKQTNERNPYTINVEDYIPQKSEPAVKEIHKKSDIKSAEDKLTYEEITKKRQQRRREGKLSDLEEIEAQLKELEKMK